MTGRKSNIGRLWIAAVVCGLASAQAMAISGRSLAIGRAFSYAYNNPQQSMGSGPLGSSVYTGQSNTVPISPYAPASPYAASPGPLAFSARSQQPIAPMAPVTIGPSGSSAYVPSSGDPASVLAAGDTQTTTTPRLTSLAPDGPGTVRGPIIQGEVSFRQGNYKQAARQFEAARSASGGSPESMLSLAQVYFAMGGVYYNEAADCLAMALKAFPDLPLVRVRPRDFFGSEQEYTAAYQALEQYVVGHPQDPRALLLLGYIQWRQGLVDKARDLLEAANKAQPGLEVAKGIATLLDGITRASQIILSEAPPMEEAREYSWAGIRLGVPGGMKFGPLSSPNQVISGIVEGKDGNEPRLVTLYAYPLAPAVTLNTAMDSVSGTLARFAFIKDMKTEAEAEVPFQTGTALVRIFTYTDASSGSRIATGWVGFIREPQDAQSPRIGYLLGVATGEKQAEDILPTLAAISKTISVGQPRSIPVASTDIAGNTFEDRQLLFSITQPRSWAGRQTEKGFDMGQMDFARGNAVSPQADVIVQAVEANATAKSFGEEAIARTVPKGMVRKILSQGPATLGGQDAYQFVVSQGPQDGASGSPSIVAGRLFVQDRPDGTRRLYALVVRCHNAEAKDVEALTDQLASTFKLLQAE
ncbi:MAG: tetratricopeptide repeat protein [Phycisphaerae bacterium]|jgi:tetratricopeptide (TPR) repeat protein